MKNHEVVTKPFDELSDNARAIIGIYEDLVDVEQYMPDKGRDFYESVMDKATSIKEWAMVDAVTDKQLDTMQNMHRGVMRWIR